MSISDLLLLGIVTFVLVEFASGRVIEFLNERNKDKPLTSVAAYIYKADEYGTTKYKVEFLSRSILNRYLPGAHEYMYTALKK